MSNGYDDFSMLTTFFSQLVSTVPLLVIWIIGLVLSLTRMGQDRRYQLTAVAFGIFLLAGLAGSFSGVLIASVAARSDITTASWVIGLFGLAIMAVNCVGWVLLLLALFRRPAPVDA
ncbi:hypothetical protein F8S13_07475 [Chloroflexia bacterium SDU3-3]|nr:hypothetical protein F8S13_07475 [Chloroflexia bacterium SDU3-3]